MKDIRITYNDNKQINVSLNTTYYELSKSVLLPNSIGVIVNGKAVNLNEKITRSQDILFIDKFNPYGNRMYVAGLKMIFELAVKRLYPKAKVCYSYSIPKTIVANITSDITLKKEEIDIINDMVNEIIKQDIKFEKLIVKSNDAINYYNDIGNYVKSSNIKNITDPTVVLYKLDTLINYYYYEMPYSTGNITDFKIKYYKDNQIIINYPVVAKDINEENTVNYDRIINSYKDGQKWLDIMGVPYIKDVNKLISEGKINNFVKSSELNFNIEINLAAKMISENKKIKYVMISGPSSSGKTTITKRLASYFKIYGLDPIVISLDDYYKERIDSPKDENGEYDFECLQATDLEYLNSDITKLINNETINLPKFNFVSGCKELSQNKVSLKENSIILLEGLHAINDELLTFIPKEEKYKIFVSPYIPICIDEQNYISNNDLRLIRRIVRDFRTRGYDVISTIKNSKKVRLGEEKYIIPLIPSADKVINTALSYEVGLLKVYVEPLLYSVDATSEYYIETRRLLSFLKQFFSISSEYVPKDSILREFIGGSEYD